VLPHPLHFEEKQPQSAIEMSQKNPPESKKHSVSKNAQFLRTVSNGLIRGQIDMRFSGAWTPEKTVLAQFAYSPRDVT